MIILNIICKVMLISQGSFRVCKNHNVILLILLTLLEKLATLLNLLKKSTTFKNFTSARAQVCHVHPTPMRMRNMRIAVGCYRYTIDVGCYRTHAIVTLLTT